MATHKTLFYEGNRDPINMTGITTLEKNGVIAVSYARRVKVEIVNGTDLSLYCTGSGSRLDIDQLECDNLTLFCGTSGNITINKLTVKNKCSIDVHYSSEMWIFGGTINVIDGTINHSSFGRRDATAVSDNVSVEAGSTYVKK